MKMSAMMQGLYKELASAARRIVQTADERIPLFAKTRTVHVSISVTTRNPRTISGDRWNACECVDERVAVRDENGLLVGWVLPGDAAVVAAAPAMLDVLRQLLMAADDDPEWLPHAWALADARALLGELDGKPSIPGQAARRRGESHG